LIEGAVKPLRDIRVLAVTVYLAGPFCAMNLARMGAEVITVEMPGRGNPARDIGNYAGPTGNHPVRQTGQDLSTMFLKRAQGVKSVTLNLKDPKGRDMLLKLAESCDVFVENLAPGSLKGMGLGYPEVSQVNPGIIYCSISGYGQEGPYANKRAHDPQIQGMSGLMDINGEEEGSPIRVGFLIGDLVTPLFACYSILAALRDKDRTGLGQHLDVSMMDTLASLMFMENLEERIEEGLPLRTGNFTRSGPTGLYRASDGDLVLTASGDDQWVRLARALDAPELTEDPRFATGQARNANLEEVRAAVQRLIGAMSVGQALERLEAGNVPCGPVRTAAEVMADPHFWERGTLQPMRHGALEEPVKGVGAGFPVLFSGKPLPELAGAPTLGMHNDEVYGRLLGLGEEDLQRLHDEKIV
jgi:formyl-CoA transferase